MLEKILPKGNDLTSSGGRKVHLPDGIGHKQSHQAQELAEILLHAEARLGVMLEKLGKTGVSEYGSSGGTIPSLPPDINKKQSHQAQELSRHGQRQDLSTAPQELREFLYSPKNGTPQTERL